MKLVWDNGSATVQAPTKLRSGWPDTPDENRQRELRHTHIYHVGVFKAPDNIRAWCEQERVKRSVADFEAWLETL